MTSRLAAQKRAISRGRADAAIDAVVAQARLAAIEHIAQMAYAATQGFMEADRQTTHTGMKRDIDTI